MIHLSFDESGNERSSEALANGEGHQSGSGGVDDCIIDLDVESGAGRARQRVDAGSDELDLRTREGLVRFVNMNTCPPSTMGHSSNS